MNIKPKTLEILDLFNVYSSLHIEIENGIDKKVYSCIYDSLRMRMYETSLIPINTAISLYRRGRFDGGWLANCLPREIAERECPEILRDKGAIAFVAKMLGELD